MSRVRANTIMDQAGAGAPDFPFGFTANSGTVTGLLTATSYDIDDLYVGSAATITATTVSTSSTTGALQVSGGVGIAKSVYIGEDLDVSGSLSVGGTITYDDIHNLDSIGIVTARTGVHIESNGLTIVGVTTGLSVAGVGTFAGVIQGTDTTQSTTKDTGAFIINGGAGIEKNLNVGTACSIEGAGIATFSQGMKVGGGNPLLEKAHINTTAWSSSNDFNLDYGNTHLNTAVLAGTANTINVTSSVGLNTAMVLGDVIAITGITSVSAATAYINALKIDHTDVQVAWVGGSAPTTGGNSGYDTYAFNIVKTGDAKDNWAIIASHTKAG